jgi:hypothetical protein
MSKGTTCNTRELQIFYQADCNPCSDIGIFLRPESKPCDDENQRNCRSPLAKSDREQDSESVLDSVCRAEVLITACLVSAGCGIL